MKRIALNAVGTAFALAFGGGALAAEALPASEYNAARSAISEEYRAGRAACNALALNRKDVCVAEVAGRRKVARAELEERYRPGESTRRAAGVARAEAAYGVAREHCDDQAASAKAGCLRDARTEEARAKAAWGDPAPTSGADGASGSAGSYLDDAAITAKVKAAVLGDASLKSAEINVETLRGSVQLSGFVGSRADIDHAMAVARGVTGVRSVRNDMILKDTQ